MESEKVALLFGTVPSWADPDDPDDRSSLLSREFGTQEGPGTTLRLALYETLANQIADDDPPAVWATAQRLLATGMDRHRVLQNLVMALNTHVLVALDGQAFDPPAYEKALDRLPLPDAADVLAAMVAVTRDRQPIGFEELEDLVSAQLGLPAGEEPYRTLLDRVIDHATSPRGPLALLAGDRVVDPESLSAGIVLTHRLTEAEKAGDYLEAGVDLAGLARRRGPLRTSGGGDIDVEGRRDGNVSWWGPEGWLRQYEPGAVIAVRADDDTVTIDVLDHEPPVDAALTAELRWAYDAEVEEPELPVMTEDLLLGMLVRDRSAFAVPRAPLSHLCAAAGLELRGCHTAHDESIWENERRLHRIDRIMDRLEDSDDRRTALAVLDCFEEQAWQTGQLRHALASLRDPEILAAVAEEMLGPNDDADRVKAVATFSEQLLAAARRPQDEAVAHWLAALAAERRGDPLAGDAHLQLAVAADSRWGPAVDRLAWYCSDRGDAVRAVELWQGLGVGPEESEDMAVVGPFARPPGPTGSKLGRNDPCWCGSGRKFKVCHLDQPVTAPLPDRVRWLCRKAGA
ncbi:MAG TPA: SEC-C domain-containing protein, partial [Actinomycetota bacterium]